MSISPLAPLEPVHGSHRPDQARAAGGANDGFARVLEAVLGSTGSADAEAAKAIEDLATGKAEDLHTVALATAKSDLAFRLALDIRNRLQSAYQQITQLQI